nr:G-protein coupled receptor Mth-like [Drosophila kikkawai]
MQDQSIFFGAFLVLIILQTAKADIPGCHFLETVNITSSQRLQNGSYLYQDLKIPVHLTGQYDYITTEKRLRLGNGSVLFYSTDTVNFRGYDCLHPNQFTSVNTESFVAAFHRSLYFEEPPLMIPGYKVGYFLNYFLFAKFSWLLALSHQLWRGFSSVNRVESEYSFGAYSIFAWGSAAVLIGVPFLIDQIWDGDPNNLQWVSGFGSYLTYIIFVLMVILVALNTTLFILTTISIIRVKLSLRHFSDQDERARNLNSRTQTFRMFASLFIVMDIQWSLRFTSFLAHWNYLIMICQYCDSCIGIFIFVLFVLKRSTLNLLKER